MRRGKAEEQMMETSLGSRGKSDDRWACERWTLIRRLHAVFSGGMKRTLTILWSLCASVGVLAFTAALAEGAVTHDFLSE
jgi:hypothetical protein